MRKILIGASAVAVLVMSSVGVLPANAGTPAPVEKYGAEGNTSSPAPAGAVHSPMTIAGIDKKIAAAHGYEVVDFRDGIVASIKAEKYAALGSNPSEARVLAVASSTYRPRTSTGVSPYNTVYGDCGESWYYISASGADWSSYTGYSVIEPTAATEWQTVLVDYDGNIIEGMGYDPGPNSGYWTGSDGPAPYLTDNEQSWGNVVYGWWSGYVTTGAVWLVDGTYCTSGDPGDGTYN